MVERLKRFYVLPCFSQLKLVDLYGTERALQTQAAGKKGSSLIDDFDEISGREKMDVEDPRVIAKYYAVRWACLYAFSHRSSASDPQASQLHSLLCLL